MAKKKEQGISLDDAFADDEDVEYAKPKKIISKFTKEKTPSSNETSAITIKSSKPISELKKGDKIKVDYLTLEIDAHYIMEDYKTTKEMLIECFDQKTDKDYQIRYFDNQVERSIEIYRLDEIVYNRLDGIKKIEW